MNEDDLGGLYPDGVDEIFEATIDALREKLLDGVSFDIGQPSASRQQIARAWIDWGAELWAIAFDDPELDRLVAYLRENCGGGPQKDIG